MPSFIVWGKLKLNGSLQDGVTVTVRNNTKSEQHDYVTGYGGVFAANLQTFTAGWAVGNSLTVTVSAWSMTRNYTVLTGIPGKQLNFTLIQLTATAKGSVQIVKSFKLIKHTGTIKGTPTPTLPLKTVKRSETVKGAPSAKLPARLIGATVTVKGAATLKMAKIVYKLTASTGVGAPTVKQAKIIVLTISGHFNPDHFNPEHFNTSPAPDHLHATASLALPMRDWCLTATIKGVAPTVAVNGVVRRLTATLNAGAQSVTARRMVVLAEAHLHATATVLTSNPLIKLTATITGTQSISFPIRAVILEDILEGADHYSAGGHFNATHFNAVHFQTQKVVTNLVCVTKQVLLAEALEGDCSSEEIYVQVPGVTLVTFSPADESHVTGTPTINAIKLNRLFDRIEGTPNVSITKSTGGHFNPDHFNPAHFKTAAEVCIELIHAALTGQPNLQVPLHPVVFNAPLKGEELSVVTGFAALLQNTLMGTPTLFLTKTLVFEALAVASASLLQPVKNVVFSETLTGVPYTTSEAGLPVPFVITLEVQKRDLSISIHKRDLGFHVKKREMQITVTGERD